MDVTQTTRAFRDHEFLLSKLPGWQSQDDGVAAVALEAGDVVYERAGSNAVAAQVTGGNYVAPGADKRIVLNGKIVTVANGDNLAAAVGKINAAVDGVTASSSAGKIRLTADDTATSIALTDGDLADLGLAPGVTAPTAALAAGYAPYVEGLTDDEKKSVGIAYATVIPGDGVSVLARGGEYNAARVTFPEDADLADEARAALAAKGVFPL